jgi:hypothetical protein
MKSARIIYDFATVFPNTTGGCGRAKCPKNGQFAPENPIFDFLLFLFDISENCAIARH